MNAITGFTANAYSDSVIGNIGTTIVNIVGGTIGFLTYGLPRLLWWDYSFLDGGFLLLKWMLLYPINAGTVLGIILIFKR